MTTVVPGTLRNGVYVPSVAAPESAFEAVVSATDFTYLTDADLHTYPPPTSPKSTITAVYDGSRQITEAFFGMHVQFTANIAAAIAATPFAIARSHDSASGMRWHNLNPSSGTFSWTDADAWVNAMYAAGKDICFLLGFTPDWASASTPNTGKYDNGTTARATNQPPANTADWDAFCSAVATRYLGKIKYYEVWNEVNYTSYWSGTAAQLAVLVRRANQVIKAIDPTAKIIAPIVQEPETGGTGNAYLVSFLDASDSAAGTGKLWIDVCGIHMYPPKYNFQVHQNQIVNVQATLDARSLTQKIWNTETGVLEPDYGVDDEVRGTWLKRSLLLSAALGVERYFWYSYDNDDMYMRPSQIAAWNEVRDLLLSGPITGCNLAPDGRVAATVGGVNVLY